MEETDNICFVCDKTIPSEKWKYQLQVTATKKRNAPVADLIQELVGDEFEVLVGERDAICSQCMNLLNLMDSLTVQLGDVKSTLSQLLQAKYNLTSDDAQLEVQYDDSTLEEYEPLHKCEDCSFQTKYEKEFNMHIRTHSTAKSQSKKPTEQVKKEPPKSKKSPATEKVKPGLSQSKRQPPTKKVKPEPSNRASSAKKDSVSTPKKSVSKSSPKASKTKSQKKKYSPKSPLTLHKKKSKKVFKPKKKKVVFQCGICDQVFPSESGIRLHCKKAHGNDKIVVSDDEYEDIQTLESSDEEIPVENKAQTKKSTKRGRPPKVSSAKTKLDFLDDWVEDDDNDDLHSPVKKQKTEDDFISKNQATMKTIRGSSLRESFEDIEDEDNDEKDNSSNPTCLFCQAKFSSVEAVQDHVKLSHRDRPHLNTGTKSNTSAINGVGSFEIDSTTDIAEGGNQASVRRKQIPMHKSYKCNLCGIKKVSLQFIRRHVKAHKRKISLQCKKCGIAFKKVVALKVHTYKCHKVASVFKKCRQCKFKFSNSTQLKNHVRKVHHRHNSKKLDRCRNKRSNSVSTGLTGKVSIEDKPKSSKVQKTYLKDSTLASKTDSSKISVSEVSSTSIESDVTQKRICPICEFETSTDFEMTKHIRKDHKIRDVKKKKEILLLSLQKKKTKPLHKCVECNVEFPKPSQLVTHLNRHKASACMELGICVYCEKVFLHKDQLTVHNNTVHENFKTSPRCSACSKVYSHAKDLKLHYLRCHFGETAEKLLKQVTEQKINNKDNDLKVNTDANDVYNKVFKELQDLTGEGNESEDLPANENDLATLTYSCPVCDFVSQDQEVLKTHLSSHAQNYCNICENIFSSDEVIRHIENHSIDFQGVKCSECKNEFHDNIHLQVHSLSAHTGLKPHKCSMCEKSYLTQKSMRLHKQSKHGENTKKSFSCGKCKTDFYSEKTFQTHVEFAHRLGLNCKYCDKSLGNIKKLVFHENNHLKEVKNIYKCSICGKVLKSKAALKCHRNIHSTSKPLTCEVCNQGFKSYHNLREHSAKHSGVQEKKYFCEICGKGFYFYDSHIRHRRIHLDPLLFQCKTCRERFQTKQKLEEHKKTCGTGNEIGS